MKDLFGDDINLEQKGKIGFKDYEAFVEKFKPKKTTDDCYTPSEIYSCILEYVKTKCDLSTKRILRPFVPGGNYKAINYKANDVVVDNPPFSILSQIIRYYIGHNIKFFLFAPSLTLINATQMRCTSIVCGAPIVYENGAVVSTSFATNIYGDDALIVDGELYKRIEAVSALLRKRQSKTRKGKVWPDNVTSSALLHKIATRGVNLVIRKESLAVVFKLDCKVVIYGGGVLLSEKAAAEKAAAEKAALSERELDIIRTLL